MSIRFFQLGIRIGFYCQLGIDHFFGLDFFCFNDIPSLKNRITLLCLRQNIIEFIMGSQHDGIHIPIAGALSIGQAQAATYHLLSQNFGCGCPKRDNGIEVVDIPAFFEHIDMDHDLHRIFRIFHIQKQTSVRFGLCAFLLRVDDNRFVSICATTECRCTKAQLWKCDGVCPGCPFYAAGKKVSIDTPTLTFRFYDGHEVTTKWQSTAKTDWWTDERRKLWGERHKRKDTNPNRNTFYEFTGFIKCGCCGANYRCQSGKRKDGTPTRSWYCTGPRSECRNPAIRDDTMKRLVADVLGLDEFDEAAMDARIENATILDHTVTFHFRDGHTESRDFLDKRHGTPWTEERREKARESMKAAWTDERREAMSERIKKIRSAKKWPNP